MTLEDAGPDQLTETYEIVNSPSQRRPIPHQFPPQPPTSFPKNIIYHVQTTLGRRMPYPPLSENENEVKGIANNVKSRVANRFKTKFKEYNVLNYEKTDYQNGNTKYILEIQISPSIKGHSLIKVDVVRAVTGADYYKDAWLA